MNPELADMRVNYAMKSLELTDVSSNPIVQFNTWFEEAKQSKVKEANAMILSTADDKGQPDARTVLLKDIKDDCFIFFTNYLSKKGEDITSNDKCALTFLWLDLERQVRIKGLCTKVSPDISENYFKSRPRESQLGAWSSPQSQIIKDRNELESKFDENIAKFEDFETLPLPDFWGGYQVQPFSLEFWQGRPNRMHDRLIYTLAAGEWKINRLAP
jgi:pyridoxamine 5'-phosphate oxidase